MAVVDDHLQWGHSRLQAFQTGGGLPARTGGIAQLAQKQLSRVVFTLHEGVEVPPRRSSPNQSKQVKVLGGRWLVGSYGAVSHADSTRDGPKPSTPPRTGAAAEVGMGRFWIHWPNGRWWSLCDSITSQELGQPVTMPWAYQPFSPSCPP
ncbi:hypothetical protein MHUMG1_05695 [Metarhizium humberi]|uniref:Uncharacterized protein n=1 Tax=Metarhizium humberi TaxID=2596975 RepID=A0A9P8MAQ9_9HYPO|nr:hypothetical protein MHUMG1_05695 [Metarhizium humberi]